MATPFSIALVALLSAPSPQEAPKKDAPPLSLLDELIAKSKQVTAFNASLTLTRGDDGLPITIQCDYRAPASIRIVTKSGEDIMSCWCVDTLMVIRITSQGQKQHSQVDVAALGREFAPIDAALAQEFAYPVPDLGPVQAGWSFTWSFDAAAQAGQFSADVKSMQGLATPFGWLETLRDKHAEPVVDGDVLRFTTDEGHFDVVLAKSNGFLRELVGRGAERTLRVRMESVDFDPPDAATPIVLPTEPAEGTDVSAQLVAQSRGTTLYGVRSRAFEVITAALDDSPWDEKARAKIETVLRLLAVHEVRGASDPLFAGIRQWIDEFSGRLHEAERAGAPADEIDEARTKAKQSMQDSIEQARTRFLAEFTLPTTTKKPLPERARRLLEIERDVVGLQFDELVRDPLLAEFAKATGAAGR